MASYLKNLESLNAASLKSLCSAVGLTCSGTKPILRAQAVNALSAFSPLPAKARILSIDMGVKNMAYALVSPSASADKKPSTRTRKKTRGLSKRNHCLQPQSKLTLHAWDRVSLLPSSPSSQVAEPAEPFSPASLALAAHALITTKLLPLKPTHVIIERQRWRTAGQAAVQEWTLRVNMLEAILHGILTCRRADGTFTGEVIMMNPRVASKFYEVSVAAAAQGEQEKEDEMDKATTKAAKKKKATAKTTKAPADEKKTKTKGKKLELKKLKIRTVESWLLGDGLDTTTTPAVETLKQRFLAKCAGGRTGTTSAKSAQRRKSNTANKDAPRPEKLDKIDDLADSLVQAAVWLTWEENKRLVRQLGVETVFLGTADHRARMNRFVIERDI